MCSAALVLLALTGAGQQPSSGGFTAPPQGGSLLTTRDPSRWKADHASVKPLGSQGLQLDFSTGVEYPSVQLPMPGLGWDLSPYAGVTATLTNLGSAPCQAALRVDNAGDWRQSPWNTAAIQLGPGASEEIRLTFGESGYPLDPAKIVAMQVFLVKPSQSASILLKDVRPFGSSKDRPQPQVLSTPADRDKPVKTPAWLGSRPPVSGAWVKTLSQEFDGSSLDQKVWSHTTWWNGLLEAQDQAYSPSMTKIRNGSLEISFEKRTIHQNDDPSLPTRPYATGHLCSFNKWSQKYGYFEARIKPPSARGLWPAFWMMPDRGPGAGPEGWKRESTRDGGMEIDIMEILTEWGPGRNNAAVHWDGYEKEHKTWGSSSIYFGPTSDGFHAFGLLWEPGRLTWYIDGVKKAVFESARVGSTPNYLIINIQSGNWATKDVDLSRLPDRMLVDYVRAWQLKGRM